MSESVTMSIHRGLTELKTIESRINAAVASLTLVAPNRKSNTKIDGLEIAEYEKKLQSDYDRAVALIARRNKIKAAIIQSNATTIVNVAGVEMTVAQAIDYKTAIENEEKLYNRLKQARREAVTRVSKENDSLPAKLENYLTNILGNKEAAKKEEVELHTQTFLDRNTYELIDPLNSAERIQELEDRIYNFKSEVDAVLSESNALTMITIQ